MSRPSARASRAARGIVGELGLTRVSRVRAGLEPAEVAVERGLGRPLAGRVGHHQRCVEADEAIALDVGLHRGQHVGVVAGSADTWTKRPCESRTATPVGLRPPQARSTPAKYIA